MSIDTQGQNIPFFLSSKAPVNPDLYSYKEFKMQKIAKSGI